MCGVDECMDNEEGAACSYHNETSWRDCAKAVRSGAISGRCPLEWGYRGAIGGLSRAIPVSHAVPERYP